MKNTPLTLLSTDHLIQQDKSDLLNSLWNREYPESLNYTNKTDFELYLNGLGAATHFLLRDKQQLLGWGCKFSRDESRWFALILSHRIQSKGWGTRIMKALKENEERLFGWVIDHDDTLKADGTRYRSPLEFYRKQGFQVISGERLEKSTISAVKVMWTKSV